MKKMWQRISTNTKIIIISLSLLLLILFLANSVEKASLLKKSEATILFKDSKLKNIVIDEPYLYFYVNDKRYKILKDAYSNEEIFELGAIDYKEDTVVLLENTMLFIFLLLILYFIYSIKHTQESQEVFVANESKKDESQFEKEVIQAQHSSVNFSDVAGVEDAKVELKEIIDFLKNPQKYKAFDISLPKGVLLVGPPGVGKTLIAKAVAGEANVPFFYQSAASFVQIYVGMGAKRVSELFVKAKEMSPSIIFIDEIDAVGKNRGTENNEEREATLNQLLTEMDGFEESSGVMVIAATNKIELLDDALLRAGRFDRRVHIGLPDFEERVETLTLYLKSKKHNVNIEKVSRLTIGFNSAALSTLINEAALNALRLNKSLIEDEDVEAVREKVRLGKFKIQNFSLEERKIQALYQAAKAITASWLEVEFEKIGILSSHFIPYNNKILSRTALDNELKVLLSGRVATKNHYGELFSNAKEDIQSAKNLSHQIVQEFYMTESYTALPNFEEQILTEANDEVVTLLSKLDAVLITVYEYLLENESITMEETRTLINKVF